jgi:hypothetical protein
MAHLLLLKVSDPKTGDYVIAKHVTNNINDGTWPDVPWLKRHNQKHRLKKEVLHFAVDQMDLLMAEQIMRDRCANDPSNKTDFIPPVIRRRPRSEETKRKQSETMKKKPPFTPEHKAKLAEALRNTFKRGRPPNISYHNADNTDKMNKKIKSNPYNQDRPKLKCPHCYKTVSINMYHRWHGDNCKSNW